MNKKTKTMVIAMVAVLTLTIVGVTYAYFASTIDNNDPQRVVVEAGNLELTFNNGNGNVEGVLSVDGDPITKTFSITNNGTYDEYARISWLNLTNTYTAGSLVYTLYKSIDNNVFTQIDTGNVPATTQKATLIDGQLIEADADTSSATYKNKTVYYKLEIRLVDLGPSVNQTADVNASFMSSFTLEQGSEPVAASPIKCLDNNGDEMTCPSANALQVGQRIAIGDQVFRYIRTTDTSDTTTQLNECADGAESIACSDGDARHPLADSQLRLLAEYNLYVGGIYNGGTKQSDIDTTAEGYGLQNANAIGWISGQDIRTATVAYGASNSSYNGSYVKGYTDTYANTLNTTYFNGESVVSGSGMTKAEIFNLCNLSNYGTCANTNPWVYTTSFWSGSATDNKYVWCVNSSGSVYSRTSGNINYFGVRPVISISTSAF